MSETIIRIFTESDTPITFISELDLQAVLTDIEGFATLTGGSSSTILNGLLRGGMTRPISDEEDLRLATVIYKTNERKLRWCYEGQNKPVTKMLKKRYLSD